MPVETTMTLLNGEKYQLVADSQLPSGKRAWQRMKRPSQPSDPGVQKMMSWRLNGPHGLSREDPAGGLLAVDYTQNMDTLYESLLIPGPKRNPIDLTSIAAVSQYVGVPTEVIESVTDSGSVVGSAGVVLTGTLSEAPGTDRVLVAFVNGLTTNGECFAGAGADWTLQATLRDTTNNITKVFTRRTTSTDTASIQFGTVDSGGMDPTRTTTGSGVLMLMSGLAADPVNVVGALGSGAPGVIVAAPSVTTTAAATLLIDFAIAGSPLATIAAPSGMTEEAAVATATQRISTFTEPIAAIGATGTRASALSPSTTADAVLIAFNPGLFPVYEARVGEFPVGGAPVGGGTAVAVPGSVSLMDEDRGSLFMHGGAFSFQVDPDAMDAVSYEQWEANVRGAAMWRNKGYLGLGSNEPMQRRATVTTTAAIYETVIIDALPVHAGPLVVGPDRIWMVDPEDSEDSVLRYSLDQLETRSNPFLVGDPGIPNTGLGTYGRSALAGSEIGAFGFTDLGIPVRVLESLRGIRSTQNGVWISTLWGWTYITTAIGLKATIPGQVENPAGPGADRRYEGPNGRVTAIWPFKDALFAAVLTTEGNTYLYRGEFDDGRYGGSTAATGRPAWFPFAYLEETTAGVIFSTGLRPTPTLLVGEDENASYWTLSASDRDISDPLYRFHTGSSAWYGTRSMRDSNTLKSPRYFSTSAEDVDADNRFQIALAPDGGAFVNVGAPITTVGQATLIPASAGVPLTTVSGYSFQPAVFCESDNDVTPPKLRGTLDLVYDERPRTIVQHTFVVELGATRNVPGSALIDFDNLSRLFSDHGSGATSPMAFELPGQTRTVYGLVVSVDAVTDMKADGIQRMTVVVQEWPVAA